MINEVAIHIEPVAMDALKAAASVLGHRLATELAKPRGRRAADISLARWFETYRLTKTVPSLAGISPELAQRLASLLQGDAIQAALQELLAIRITDADDIEAGRAREAFCLTISTSDPDLASFGPPLGEYYDDEICELVARLEAAEPTILSQIRSEAMSTRMIAILRAVERHTAALSARPNLRSEASFLSSYRSHVLEEHGKLEPPDFDRRRRVPIADIYVPGTIYEEVYPGGIVAPRPTDPPTLTMTEFARQLDRSVLLGDPGGGKTTASNVLMHRYASDAALRIPFLVTLRNYAASDPPEHSVVGFIENGLETFYQCPPLPGLVDMLLLAGRAVVIFDGLDELLDTTRRADVASRVEHFCREYPQARVLVTSRLVGYDQARLDETQFTCYRLGGFRNEDVSNYARKWFALEEGARPGDAEAFLVESESVPDLRSNPLLLSLMCILYRGEGSLPRNRAGVYEQCSNLLFRRWDRRRHISHNLRAGRLLEPVLRHLAWWLFTRDNTQTAVTERELVSATAKFLHGRGFESEEDARDAANEFIDFCRSRMWVFNEAGTTASGEKLYAFTHRTFLEYFAAAQLAYDSDTPEKLAQTLTPRVTRGEWEVVSELAVQIKDATSNGGARRVYEALLTDRRRRSTVSRSNALLFLARALRSVDPSPRIIRNLAHAIIDFMVEGDPNEPVHYLPFSWLLASCGACIPLIDEVVSDRIATLIASPDEKIRLNGLRLGMWVDQGLYDRGDGEPGLSRNQSLSKFWANRAREIRGNHRQEIIAAATEHVDIRNSALRLGIITVTQALEMRGGLQPLLQEQSAKVFRFIWMSYLINTLENVMRSSGSSRQAAEIEAVGHYLTLHPHTPWVCGRTSTWPWDFLSGKEFDSHPVSSIEYLGAAAILLCISERNLGQAVERLQGDSMPLGKYSALYLYMRHRHALDLDVTLPELPVPGEFKQVFRDWAEGNVNFVQPAPD